MLLQPMTDETGESGTRSARPKETVKSPTKSGRSPERLCKLQLGGVLERRRSKGMYVQYFVTYCCGTEGRKQERTRVLPVRSLFPLSPSSPLVFFFFLTRP